MNFRVTAAVEIDLNTVWHEGLERFGLHQATNYLDGLQQAFELLVDFPQSYPERIGMSGPYRIYPYGAHLVLYRIEDDRMITILRIRHGREDWHDE